MPAPAPVPILPLRPTKEKKQPVQRRPYSLKEQRKYWTAKSEEVKLRLAHGDVFEVYRYVPLELYNTLADASLLLRDAAGEARRAGSERVRTAGAPDDSAGTR